MIFQDLRQVHRAHFEAVVLPEFSDWSQELIRIIESRVFAGTFQMIADYLTAASNIPVTRLTDSVRDEQLVFCSQYLATLELMRDELDIYMGKVARGFDTWYAVVSERVRESILEGHRQEIDSGFRTKSNYGVVSAADIKAGVLRAYGVEHEQWALFLDETKRAKSVATNLAHDLSHRSYILMSLRKKLD